jgi:hypothetical protein
MHALIHVALIVACLSAAYVAARPRRPPQPRRDAAAPTDSAR